MDRAAESNRMMLDAWDVLNRDCPGFAHLKGSIFEAAWSGHPVPFFNVAMLMRKPDSAAEFEAGFDELLAWIAPRSAPWMTVVAHETAGDQMPVVESVLAARGFVPFMKMTGMEATGVQPPSRPAPEGVYRNESSDPVVGGAAMRLNEAAYQMKMGDPGVLEPEHAGWWKAPERLLTVLESGGKPVSCSAVWNVGGVRYVALVATHPESQNRGFAEAAMRDVLERSLNAGLSERTYLHATEAGRPTYERMGYRATANYTIYVPGEAH